MANSLYAFGRQSFLDGNVGWSGDSIRVILVDVDFYTFSKDGHRYLADVPSAARVATCPPLTGKTSVDGVARADDVTFIAVTGNQAEALIVYKWTGSDATSILLAYLDTVASGLPVSPNGTDINIQWSTGDNGIFKL